MSKVTRPTHTSDSWNVLAFIKVSPLVSWKDTLNFWSHHHIAKSWCKNHKILLTNHTIVIIRITNKLAKTLLNTVEGEYRVE